MFTEWLASSKSGPPRLGKVGWNLLRGWWETQLLVTFQEAATQHVGARQTELPLHHLWLPAVLSRQRIFKGRAETVPE